MIIKYSKIRANSNSKEALNSILNIDMENMFLKFSIEFSPDKAAEQILKYSNFTEEFWIVSTEKSRLITHFGFSKINGTFIYLLHKGSVGMGSYSHIGFISDDFKIFNLKENFYRSEYEKNNLNQIRVTKPIEILGTI
ncbi:hypothetical protein [Empedobacter sp.]|uniref:hypothetical protein n=1 Tax=Empedobacter sp. TaxID=1927715 RepID=UPI00289D6B72|nr:hypothetical protein [Empedobacter sp.]